MPSIHHPEPMKRGLKHSTVRRCLWVQDLAILTACAGVASSVSSWPAVGGHPFGWWDASPVIGCIVLTWSALLAVNGEYRYRAWGFGIDEFSRVITASLETFALLILGLHLAHDALDGTWALTFFLLAAPALIAGRRLARALIHHLRATGVGQERALLVGAPEPTAALTTVLNRERWLGLVPVGTLHPRHELDSAGTIMREVTDSDAEVVLLCDGSFRIGTDFNLLARALERVDVHMVVVPTLTDISARRIDMAPAAGLPLVLVEKPHAQRALSPAKRAADIVVAGTALLLTAPVTLVAGILLKLEDGGPVIFTQERIGRHGRPFTMFKLRSMQCDAEQRQPHPPHGDGNGVLFKMREDPRVTRVGRVLRRYSIDELPQLWNVLIGDMSLVGPRPALQCEVDAYLPAVRRRLEVRPGITGLWQVSGRSDLSWEDTVRLDLYYVDNWSMLQDAQIVLRTVRAVLLPRGAY